MKIKCTRDSKWGNPRNGGSQTFKQGQILVVGEDVKEKRAEDMLRCDYAAKVGETEVKETKASQKTDTTEDKADVKAKEEKTDNKNKKKGFFK